MDRKRRVYVESEEKKEDPFMDSVEQNSTEAVKVKSCRVKIPGFLRMRETPSDFSKTVEFVTADDKLQLLSNRKVDGRYYRVRNIENGNEGYVNSEFVDVI